MTGIVPIRIAVLLFWILGVTGGFAVVLNFQSGDGLVGTAPELWPPGTKLALDHERKTLIMFAHPKCPCTRASIEELNRLLARCSDRVTAQVWFFQPGGFPSEWAKGDL